MENIIAHYIRCNSAELNKNKNMRETTIERARTEWTGPEWDAENAPSVKEEARLREKYISYNEAMKESNWELVKKNQPFDPAKPSPVYPKRIQFEIFNRLDRLGMANQYDDVFYYSAGKSMLDQHGVDGWFEHGGARAAVDWTINEAKKGGYKSILIFPEDVEIPEKFDKKMEEIMNALLENKRQKAAAQKQKSGYQPLIQRNRK